MGFYLSKHFLYMFGSQRDPKWDPRWDREDPRWDFNSPNIFYICLVHRGIPGGILESHLGSRVGFQNKPLPQFPRWDPRLDPGWLSPVPSYSVRSATVSSLRDRDLN